MIELRNVVKKFGSFTAVDNLSLRLGKGEFFGFLGLNGAGKTTTIKIMTGLFEPTSGSCWINGHNVHTEPMLAKRSTGYVPDQPWLYDKLTGREFLYFVGGLFGMSPAALKERIGEMVDALEIGGFVDRRGEEYSLGMRQRVVLAAALLHDPQVLIIDEPLVGLDPRSARLIKDLLKAKARQGTTVFMSSHLLEVVDELCDRIAIIKNGHIIYEQMRDGSHTLNGKLETMFLEMTR
jgi:ABC-2 type transport system ATP-binding protein